MTHAAARVSNDWRMFGVAAIVSVVTMPLTAMWFLLFGGTLVVAGLLPAAFRTSARIGATSLVGLGLLLGPAIYLSLAAVQ